MKILIVEDEYNAREGLAALIEKLNPEYTVCGKAADGDEGCALALALKPELMFVDIELPKQNGLEMIAKIKEELQPPPHFVILSGYAEFQYAQQAIQYGVEEYLLKPITREKLNILLEKMAAAISLKSAQSAQKTLSKDQLLKSVLLNAKDGAEEALGQLKASIFEKNLYLIGIYYGKDAVPANLRGTAEAFCAKVSQKNAYFAALEEQCFETVLLSTELSQSELARKINCALLFALKKQGLDDCTVCLLPVKSLDALPGMFSELVKLNEWALTLGNDGVICPEQTAQIRCESDKKIERFDVKALTALKNENAEELNKISHAFCSYLQGNSFPPEQIRRICTSFAFSILAYYKEMNPELYEKVQGGGLLDRIKGCCTQKELNACLTELVDVYQSAPQLQQGVNSILVKKIIHYINDSYIDKVSLEDIAVKMNVSSEYLSHLFTKEVGISFSEYLKKYRITVAKKLMSSYNYKIYEIGEKIGYRDPKYFCKVFKEVTGYSPKEYMSMQ